MEAEDAPVHSNPEHQHFRGRRGNKSSDKSEKMVLGIKEEEVKVKREMEVKPRE